MATFTTDQEILLFNALEVPYSTNFKFVDTYGTMIIDFELTSGYIAAYDAIKLWLTNMADAVATRLKAYLVQWESVMFSVVTITQGGTSDITGASFNPADKRIQIKNAICGLVPFFKAHERLNANKQKNTSVMINTVR